MSHNNKHEQREMPLLCGVRPPVLLPMEVIMGCDSKEDAIQECWNHRRDKSLRMMKAAERMGLSRAQFTKLISGQSGMRGNQERALQMICGNLAITQFQAWEVDCQLMQETWAQRHARRASDRRADDAEAA